MADAPPRAPRDPRGAATDALPLLADSRFSALPPRGELPLGAVVAVAWLESVEVMTPESPESIEAASPAERGLGDWQPVRFAWSFAGVMPIAPACRPGALGLWSWEPSPEALDACRRLVASHGGRVAHRPKVRKCRVEGCRLAVLAQAFCAEHYTRARVWIRADRKARSWASPELDTLGGPPA